MIVDAAETTVAHPIRRIASLPLRTFVTLEHTETKADGCKGEDHNDAVAALAVGRVGSSAECVVSVSSAQIRDPFLSRMPSGITTGRVPC